MIEAVIFYVFGAVLVAAAIGVIASRNPVHSAMFLVLCFFTSAFLWMLLAGEVLTRRGEKGPLARGISPRPRGGTRPRKEP